MSPATNGLAGPSKACEMGFSAEGRVALIGRLWYKSAAQPTQSHESISQIVRYGYAPDVTAPRGMVCGHRPITEREVNCVI
jgi:hypothetical protein